MAESLTCGALVNALGGGDRAEEWLAGGVTAYRMRVKVDVLGVPEDVDPCSAECAEALAVGVRDLLGADVAVSATGVGGPDADGDHPPGTVYLGWADDEGVGHHRLTLTGTPEEVLGSTVAQAVALLARRLG